MSNCEGREREMAARSITCVKKLSESPNLSSIPSNYVYYTSSTGTTGSDPGDSIPIIDLSLLTSDNFDQKAKAIHDLDKACQDWGFFMVVNHGIPEELMRGIIEATDEFFNLAEEEKPEFQPKDVLSPIRYGTSFNTETDNAFCWRDFLKVFVHPEFNCPHKPESLRDLLPEYCERIRGVVNTLLKGMSNGLGLDESETEKALDIHSSLQIFVANFYPPCPNPNIAVGMPPHSDHGLFTLLIQNQVGGLQIQHDGKWVNVNALPNSILVNTSDHLEVFSNGKYKSVLHRAVVNNEKTRISIAMANGPSADTIVSPALKLLQKQGCVPSYAPMKYKDYLFAQQSNFLNEVMKRLTYLIDGEMILKYQLVSDDLDALVSVKSDEDLGHMFDEIEHYGITGSPRMRAFLFPANNFMAENQTGPLPLEQRYIYSINGINTKQIPSLPSSACSSPRSPDSWTYTGTPEASLIESLLHNNIYKTQSSQQIRSQYSLLHSQSCHGPGRNGAAPERLVSVRSVGRGDAITAPPQSYYASREINRTKCMQFDACTHFSDGRNIQRQATLP